MKIEEIINQMDKKLTFLKQIEEKKKTIVD